MAQLKALAWVSMGVVLGAMPGLVLLGLTIPVNGEAELSVGAVGLIGSLVGALGGGVAAIVVYRERRGTR